MHQVALPSNILQQVATNELYIKEFKDADIIQNDGHDQYTNLNANNPQ